jgi:acetylornithine aminotransferase/acetylornithine/N-succinyldiaminopimelate aminotransferase
MKLDLRSNATNQSWQERWAKSSMGNYAPAPVAFARGQGSYLWDVEGKKYLDFAAGVAVCSVGHAHPKLAVAIAEQAKTLMHTSNLYLVPNQIELAERLIALSGLHRAFFCNSGTEAVEAAMKLARYWGAQNGGRTDFVATSHAFHGRTMGALTLTRNPKYQEHFAPLVPGVTEVPYNDVAAIERAITNKTCAVVLEPIQGEGGVNVPAADYLARVRRVCDQAGVLLILDEVQTGIGRTGDWFAFQRSGIRPDILALAKGLGGGFPIGAVLCNEKANVFVPGTHGSTFGGNPLACAAGLTVLRILEEERVLANVKKQGAHIVNHLAILAEKAPFDGLRGAGLLIGFDLTKEKSKPFAQTLLRQGLLVSNIGDATLRLAPPLTISAAEIEEGFDLLSKALGAHA